MGMGNAPVIILREGTKRDKGKDAQFNNISAAMAIASAVKSSLGPRGMDKMLVDSVGDVVITNDGVTILKEMDVQHPAAKMLVEVAKTQDAEVGDGTTTSVILAGELLKKATDLIDANVHPTIITAGYRLANDKAQEVLKNISMKVSIDDDDLLKLIAQTAMISKQVNNSKEYFSNMVVDAVKTVVDKDKDGKYFVDLKNIQTVKKAGAKMEESYIVKGLIIDKEPVQPSMPKLVEGAKIALIDAPFEVKKTEIDAKIRRGGEDAEGHGHEGQGLRSQRRLLPEGNRRPRPALLRQRGHLCLQACQEVRHGEARKVHRRQHHQQDR